MHCYTLTLPYRDDHRVQYIIRCSYYCTVAWLLSYFHIYTKSFYISRKYKCMIVWLNLCNLHYRECMYQQEMRVNGDLTRRLSAALQEKEEAREQMKHMKVGLSSVVILIHTVWITIHYLIFCRFTEGTRQQVRSFAGGLEQKRRFCQFVWLIYSRRQLGRWLRPNKDVNMKETPNHLYFSRL